MTEGFIFVSGLIIGSFVGMMALSLVSANRRDDE